MLLHAYYTQWSKQSYMSDQGVTLLRPQHALKWRCVGGPTVARDCIANSDFDTYKLQVGFSRKTFEIPASPSAQ